MQPQTASLGAASDDVKNISGESSQRLRRFIASRPRPCDPRPAMLARGEPTFPMKSPP